MLYNFDEPIERKGTDSIKWDSIIRDYADPSIIGMRIADEDFAAAPGFLNIMKELCNKRIFGYAEANPVVKEGVAKFYAKRTGWNFDPQSIDFAAGVVPIVVENILLHSKVGDQVATFAPSYPPLLHAPVLNKRELLPIAMDYDEKNGKYSVNWELLENSLTKKTKIFLLCNPYNPLGIVWSKSDLERLANICLERKIVIISDEIHGFITFGEHSYTPMASISEKIAQNTITCASPSKLFGVAGIIYAFSVIPNAKWHQQYLDSIARAGLVNFRNIIGLNALKACYSDENDEWLQQKLAYIQNNSRMVDQYFADNLPHIISTPSQGTFLKWINFRATGLSDDALEKKLIQEARVALQRGDDFGLGGEGFCRMNIGCTQLTLKTALGQIYNAFTH